MISPKNIKEKIYTNSYVKELVEKLDAALSEDKNMKDAICGQVVIKIPELFAPYVTIAITHLYKDAGWKSVFVDTYTYTSPLYSITSDNDESFKLYGTKFIFQM